MSGHYGFWPYNEEAQKNIVFLPVAAAQTWAAGDPVYLVGGLVTIAAATTTELLGIAASDIAAPATGSLVPVHLIGHGEQFLCSITGTTAATDPGTVCDLSGTTGAFRVNKGATTYQQVHIKEVIDATTATGDVVVEFQYAVSALALGSLGITAALTVGTTVTVGTGLVVTAGGATVQAGDVGVTLGDLTVDAGDITATLGDIVATAGALEAGTTVTGGTGLIATTGGCDLTAGDLDVDAGDINVTLGDIIVAAGDVTATLGALEAGTTVTAGTGLVATTGGCDLDAGDLDVTLGDINVVAGDVTVTAGDIVATAGDIQAVSATGTIWCSHRTSVAAAAAHAGLGANMLQNADAITLLGAAAGTEGAIYLVTDSGVVEQLLISNGTAYYGIPLIACP